ncbi:MAG TPA: hypothetical protein VHE99_00025 [Gammaproteobacteria bacterium]|nr:hypothetical protein [Gammaproteobacteria bacterium]
MEQAAFKTFFYNKADQEQFNSIFIECSKSFGCNYMGYIYEDLASESRLGFNTNAKWQQEFIGQQLINNCHLWNTVCGYFINSHTNQFILPWEYAKPKSSLEKEIALYRGEFGIGNNGISFCNRFSNSREFFFFAPGNDNKKFLQVILKNLSIIKQYLATFRKLSLESVTNNDIIKD